MKSLALAVIAGVISFLAFPPFGPGWLIIVGVALYLMALRRVGSRRLGLGVGALYGLVFFGGLMWWLGRLDALALILVPVQALFFALHGWLLARYRTLRNGHWAALAVGAWALMELVRYRFPVGGQEWGAAGYALSDNLVTRTPAAVVGTSGLTVLVVLVAAQLVLAFSGFWRWGLATVATAGVVLFALVASHGPAGGPTLAVAIVQGSTPCPFEHCPPNERLRTFEQHLELTRTIERGAVDLVVWPESSTGSSNADPVNNPEVGEAVAAEAERIGAAMLIGGDQVVGDDRFINANVFFDAGGEIVGQYDKQHPVPFGEYIPWRPLFEWIPALDQVPRDMIPGGGPVIFDLDGIELGSVISWEGGFSRYALEHRRAGADVLVVATNKASYGPEAPTSDQFIGMTRMRALELGIPVIHAAVTGKSAIIDGQGSFDDTTATGESVVLYGEIGPPIWTLYAVTGDLLLYLAAILGIVVWSRVSPLVGSGTPRVEEE